MCALAPEELREGAAGARGQVNEAVVLQKEEQAWGPGCPSPTPAVTGWAGWAGGRGSFLGQQHWHWAQSGEGGSSGRCAVPGMVS